MFWQLIDPSVNSVFIQNINNTFVSTSSFLFWIFVLAGLLMSITIHEWAHAYSAHILGDDTANNEGRMNINPLNHFDVLGLLLILLTFIGYGKPVPVNAGNFRNPARSMMIVALAGPTSNLIIAFFCGIGYLALKPFAIAGDLSSPIGVVNGLLSTLVYSFGTIGFYNLGLMVFNMLPVHPLDGRKVWGYVHYSINDLLSRFIDPYGLWILLIFILPLFGGFSIISLIAMPFYIIYSLVFGVYIR